MTIRKACGRVFDRPILQEDGFVSQRTHLHVSGLFYIFKRHRREKFLGVAKATLFFQHFLKKQLNFLAKLKELWYHV